jgi:prepilin-type processing-associated H-X9-DG protein
VHKVGHVAQSDNFSVYAPRSYVPRHSRLGRGSLKVFVADGLRYFDEGSGNITYNTETTTAKGNHCATPPSTGGTAWEFNREYNMARKLSYRHGNNDAINAGFFDGHVELLRVEAGQQQFRGKAIDPRWYYPSGSVVRDPSELHKDTLIAGSTLP